MLVATPVASRQMEKSAVGVLINKSIPLVTSWLVINR